MLTALDLFDGAPVVALRMTKSVQTALASLKGTDLQQLENLLQLEPKKLANIAFYEEAVDYRLFEALTLPLDLSIQKVLGSPNIDDESRAFWQREMGEHPLAMAEQSGTGFAVNLPKGEPLLKLYVTLRAVAELNTDSEPVLGVECADI